MNRFASHFLSPLVSLSGARLLSGGSGGSGGSGAVGGVVRAGVLGGVKSVWSASWSSSDATGAALSHDVPLESLWRPSGKSLPLTTSLEDGVVVELASRGSRHLAMVSGMSGDGGRVNVVHGSGNTGSLWTDHITWVFPPRPGLNPEELPGLAQGLKSLAAGEVRPALPAIGAALRGAGEKDVNELRWTPVRDEEADKFTAALKSLSSDVWVDPIAAPPTPHGAERVIWTGLPAAYVLYPDLATASRAPDLSVYGSRTLRLPTLRGVTRPIPVSEMLEGAVKAWPEGLQLASARLAAVSRSLSAWNPYVMKLAGSGHPWYAVLGADLAAFRATSEHALALVSRPAVHSLLRLRTRVRTVRPDVKLPPLHPRLARLAGKIGPSDLAWDPKKDRALHTALIAHAIGDPRTGDSNVRVHFVLSSITDAVEGLGPPGKRKARSDWAKAVSGVGAKAVAASKEDGKSSEAANNGVNDSKDGNGESGSKEGGEARRAPPTVNVFQPGRTYEMLMELGILPEDNLHRLRWETESPSSFPRAIETELRAVLDAAVEIESDRHSIGPSMPSAAERITGTRPVPGKRVVFDERTPVIAVDSPGTWEVDDGVSISRDGENTWVCVHVADPTAVVGPHSLVANVARARATSIYLPEAVIPMLPPALGGPAVSLREGTAKRALTIAVKLSPKGEMLDRQMFPSVVSRVVRMDYEGVDAVLAGKRPSEHEDTLRTLVEIGEKRRAARLEAGAIELELPEPMPSVTRTEGGSWKVSLNSWSGDGSDTSRSTQPSQVLVSESMILAGEAVGSIAAEAGVPIAFRTQSSPSDLGAWSNALASRRAAAHPIAGEVALLSQLPGGLNSATPDGGHFALGLDVYARATSPIRRWADMLTHWQMKEWMAGREPVWNVDEVRALLDGVNDRERAVKRFQRRSGRFWTLYALSQRRKREGLDAIVMSSWNSGDKDDVEDVPGEEKWIGEVFLPSTCGLTKMKLPEPFAPGTPIQVSVNASPWSDMFLLHFRSVND